MKLLKNYILLILVAFYYHGDAQPKNDSIFNETFLSAFKLKDASTRKTISLHATKKQRIFIFLSPECPICQNYTSLLNKLKSGHGNTIQLIGIIPGKAYTTEEVNAFAKKYSITFPLLIDESFALSHYLQAAVTPEVIFLNTKNEMIYRGAIDNWFKSLGKARIKITENYLLDAITENEKHNPAPQKRTKPVGCLINNY